MFLGRVADSERAQRMEGADSPQVQNIPVVFATGIFFCIVGEAKGVLL